MIIIPTIAVKESENKKLNQAAWFWDTKNQIKPTWSNQHDFKPQRIKKNQVKGGSMIINNRPAYQSTKQEREA
jgi:hypothetical protein